MMRNKKGQFVKGHPSPNRGKKLSDETKKKVSAGLKKYYKENPEARKKIGRERKEYWENNSHPNQGKSLPKDVKEKISKTVKRQFESGERVPWQKGKECPQISKSKKEYYKSHPAPMEGKHHSKETKKKISESNKGRTDGVKNLIPFKNGEHGNPDSEFKKNDPRLIGENNPNWNNGASTLSQKVMAIDEYKNWRNFVFKRDKYTCQICGDNTGSNLRAHHIVPRRELKDKYNLNSLEDILNEERFFEVENGITLCKQCHKLHHDLNSYKKSTPDELGGVNDE